MCDDANMLARQWVPQRVLSRAPHHFDPNEDVTSEVRSHAPQRWGKPPDWKTDDEVHTTDC